MPLNFQPTAAAPVSVAAWDAQRGVFLIHPDRHRPAQPAPVAPLPPEQAETQARLEGFRARPPQGAVRWMPQPGWRGRLDRALVAMSRVLG